MITTIRLFNYKIYLQEFLVIFFCFLLVEKSFIWFFSQNAYINEVAIKALSIAIYGYVLIKVNDLKLSEKIYVGIFTALMVKLLLQSLIEFQVFFRNFEIYTVIFPIIFTIFIKSEMRKMNADLLGFLAGFYLLSYLVFMALFGHNFSFSLEHIEPNTGPFSGDTRILHAHSIFMLIIPFLWYLNKFINKQTIQSFLLFALCFTIILVHQHRSVWSSVIFATFVYFILVLRTNKKALTGVASFTLTSILALIIAIYFVSATFPGLLSFFGERFSEILNPSTDSGTGGFRIEQTEMYYNFIKQKPLFGWTFEGYSLENPLVDWWDANTGHHFHEGFVEILFYHGIFGLLFKFSFLIYIFFKSFSRHLSNRAVVLIPFCLSGLVFSLSYVAPLIFWGHVGLCLYYLESNKTFKS
ncbi:hypothetical protein ADIARSV_2164 [Arcticibacter svalbardensis MN12-7]|uniref:O-antigen ligase-related domain-containing protein n=1 Tax=Arcticibacter svalbardensis MN12-7 TaxID=1150600 RepID=R9GS69_9SPHI|nr:O-antigen ligase family protein [Arcticibacter svalbardensis]EOR94566.1 hypothetical protein ADIARSV_2164 [Arcticibacter svalbardensis MN12-7]